MFWLLNFAAWFALGLVLGLAGIFYTRWPYWAIIGTAAIIQLTGMAAMQVG